MPAAVLAMAAVLLVVVAGCGSATPPLPASQAPVASPSATLSDGASAAPTPSPTKAPVRTIAPLPTLPPEPAVYFAPLGSFPAKTLQTLVKFYKDTYNLNVTTLPASPVAAAARDTARKQVIAEELITSLQAAYPKVVADPTAVIIGLVTDDLYIRSRTDWDWAFGLRDGGRFAVVSTGHMSFPGEAASIQMTRLRKMVTRDLGVLYFGFPLNDDPGSLLYTDIAGVDDLDRVTEDLPGLTLPGPASF